MYDSIATLKAIKTVTHDTEGNATIVYTDTTVCVMPRGVYNAEFYNAAQVGLHPSIVLEMANRADYHDEKLVEFDGQLYDVIRADWTAQRDKISLTLQKRVNNG